jgi:hypothetical protein
MQVRLTGGDRNRRSRTGRPDVFVRTAQCDFDNITDPIRPSLVAIDCRGADLRFAGIKLGG